MAHPLDKRPDETIKAYASLMDFYRMGIGAQLRDLLHTYQNTPPDDPRPPTKSYYTIKRWCHIHHWFARMDEARILAEQERQEAEKALWEERRKLVLQADYDLGETLRQMVVETLAQYPNFVKTQRRVIPGQNGEPDREIITLAIKEHAILRAVELASRLQRQSTGLGETTQVKGTVQDGNIQLLISGNVDPEDF